MNAQYLDHAAQVIRCGGIVAYATEHCFGLGCDPLNHAAVMRLLRIKQRPANKGLILIAAYPGQLGDYVVEFPPEAMQSWPGPHTWLLPAKEGAPPWILGQHERIAVRVTAHEQAASLCRAARMAIVSTSANRASEEPARTYREAVRRLGHKIDYVLPGRVGGLPHPTPIRDAATGEVVRAG